MKINGWAEEIGVKRNGLWRDWCKGISESISYLIMERSGFEDGCKYIVAENVEKEINEICESRSLWINVKKWFVREIDVMGLVRKIS